MNGFYNTCRRGERLCAMLRARFFALKTPVRTALFALLLAIFLMPFAADGQCTLACNSLVNVSLDQAGEAVIAPETVCQNAYNPASCSPTGPQFFEVAVMFPGGQPLPNSPIVTCDEVGKTLTVKVLHTPTGNNCWGQINIRDYLPPTLACPDVTVSCNTADLSPANPLIGAPSVADNCTSASTLYRSDQMTDVPCGQTASGQNVAAFVARSWLATDASGNSSTCTQRIWLARRTVNDLIFPPNRDGFAAPTLDCLNPNTTPANTGQPMLDGRPLDGQCELSAVFSDQNIASCGNTRSIARTWTALDWCSNQIRTHTQIIVVADHTPPSLVCPQNMSVGTSATDCFAAANLPAAQVSDACSAPVSVKIFAQNSALSGNGGLLTGIATGSQTVTYEATDACGNLSTCAMILTVEDRTPPQVVCSGALTVALSSGGTGTVFAKAFDAGSTDNCCAASELLVRARRMDDSVFAQKIVFDCADIGPSQMVVVRVTDCAGNANECMVFVEVQDKTKPAITCPPAATAHCNVFSINDLAAYGTAKATDNCSAPNVVELAPDALNLTDCGTGWVVRWFQATDAGGRVATCTQRVTVVNSTAWDGAQNIAWPADFTTNKCATSAAQLAPDSLPPSHARPVLSDQSGCNTLSYSFEDQVFSIAPPACFKIFRRWKVVDWCRYSPNDPSGPGQWSHVQTIAAMDVQPPVFVAPPADLTLSTEANCVATVNLPQPLVLDCAANVNLTATSSLGTGFGPFFGVAAGVYPVTYTATDGCGNVATHHFTLSVADRKPPSVICHNGLSISLMQSGTVAIWAKDFDAGSADNCSPSGLLQFSFSQNPADTGRVFDCQNLGANVLDVWAHDATGNASFCSTYLIVQDNLGACAPATASVAGAVRTMQQTKLAGVTLRIGGTNALPDVVTDTSGAFAFAGLPVNVAYSLTPSKTDGWQNGVSTYDLLLISKHLLGVEPLDSPLKLIAADANRSGTITSFDILQLRKLILGVADSVPGNSSWRFVDAAYTFPDLQNPFAEAFPETKSFAPLAPSGGLADFTAIKIGDLNGSAAASFSVPPSQRAEHNALVINILNRFRHPKTTAY